MGAGQALAPCSRSVWEYAASSAAPQRMGVSSAFLDVVARTVTLSEVTVPLGGTFLVSQVLSPGNDVPDGIGKRLGDAGLVGACVGKHFANRVPPSAWEDELGDDHGEEAAEADDGGRAILLGNSSADGCVLSSPEEFREAGRSGHNSVPPVSSFSYTK